MCIARGVTREEYAVIKTMIRAYVMPWYLLELPCGQWGALWNQGLGTCHAYRLLDQDYRGLAFIGTQAQVQQYIYNDVLVHKDEGLYKGFFKPTNRMFYSVQPGRQARSPKWDAL
jgi:hypothetical protein